jgi:hypothetical protein
MDSLLQQVVSGTTLPYNQIDRWIHEAKFQEIEQFAQALAQVWDNRPSEQWRYAGTYNRIVDGLALQPGAKRLEVLFAVLVHRSQDDALMRRVAAQLAHSQSPDVLDHFAKSPLHRTLWDYLLHELVIEGVTMSRHRNLLQMARAMRDQNHPLSHLPLNLVSSEAELHRYRRHYGVGISSASTSPIGPGTRGQNRFGLMDKPATIQLDETTTPALQAHLQAAFENWQRASNGRIEARQFTAQTTLSAEAITDTRLLLDLKLDCLADATLNKVSIWEIPGQLVINSLFSAAANGGAYNRGVGNAYARLYMWQSVAGLINMPVATPITTLNAALADAQWFHLESDSGWFYRVAWDDAILALSADRRVLTILAATDTD